MTLIDFDESIIETETFVGAAFYDDNGQLDAVFNIDGEALLMSEMADAGMIDACGWFSKLIKKVVKVVAVVVAVVAVAVAVVATAGIASVAVVGVGVGTIAVGTTTAVTTVATSLAVAIVAVGVLCVNKKYKRTQKQ
jgi:hypothetical protein